MNKLRNFMHNPFIVLGSMGIGVFLGIKLPKFSQNIQWIGEVYLIFISMTVLPILVSAIVSSVGNFVQQPALYKLTFYALKVIIVAMIIIVSFSLILGLIFKPGILPVQQAKVLSEYIGAESSVFEFDLYGVNGIEDEGFVKKFLKILIPANILDAFINNNALGLAFISIVMGISAGLLSVSQNRNRESVHTGNIIIEFFESVFKIFQVIIGWTLTFIPIALICIIASQISGFGFTIIFTTIKLIVLYYIAGGILMLFNSFLAGFFFKKRFLNMLKFSFRPTMIGFATKNSVAAIPITIRSLSSNLKCDAKFPPLLVPLFIILCRYGNMVWFGLVSIFATQIYGESLGIGKIIILIIAIICAGIATAGANGFASLGVIAIALIPLGIPTETILFILLAIDPIVDPLRTAINVQTNFCTVAIVCSKKPPSSTDRVQAGFLENIETVNV